MLEDAAVALEEIAPGGQHRNEVLGARIILYMGAKKWDMGGSRLPGTLPRLNHKMRLDGSAYSIRRSEGIDKAEAILL